jgi:hypothetical protein
MGMPKQDGVRSVIQSLVLFIEATSFGELCADLAGVVVRLRANAEKTIVSAE